MTNQAFKSPSTVSTKPYIATLYLLTPSNEQILPPSSRLIPTFSDLPDETLKTIFDYAGPGWHCPAFSRRFYRFSRAHLFRSLSLSLSNKRYSLARQTFLGNSVFSLFLQELKLDLQGRKKRSGAGCPTKEELFQLFSNLPNLVELDMVGSAELIDGMIESKELIHLAHKLRRLTLDSRKIRYKFDENNQPYRFDPFDTSKIHGRFAQAVDREIQMKYGEVVLEIVDMSSRDSSTQLLLPSTTSTSPSSCQLRSRSLKLRPVQPRTIDVSCLLANRLVDSIILIDPVELTLFNTLLERLHAQCLLRLSLSGNSQIYALNKFETLLSTFHNLTHLSLSGSACPTSSSFYDLLPSLPLRSLHFGPGSDVAALRLIPLIEMGPSRIETLRLLRLDNIAARIPTTNPRSVFDWVHPQWTVRCRAITIEILREEAITAGVTVEGSTFFALEMFGTSEYRYDYHAHRAMMRAEEEEKKRKEAMIESLAARLRWGDEDEVDHGEYQEEGR